MKRSYESFCIIVVFVENENMFFVINDLCFTMKFSLVIGIEPFKK